MKVTLLLADSAQAVEGKLYILGGGWSVIDPGPLAMAMAIKVEVPWVDANKEHQLKLVLMDEEGRPAEFPGPDGRPFTVEIGSLFKVGRPPDLSPGTPLDIPLALNVNGIPLEPGKRYQWHLSINGETDENWQVSFSTRTSPSPTPSVS